MIFLDLLFRLSNGSHYLQDEGQPNTPNMEALYYPGLLTSQASTLTRPLHELSALAISGFQIHHVLCISGPFFKDYFIPYTSPLLPHPCLAIPIHLQLVLMLLPLESFL